jgi:xylulose-5-phosphate/fructose-6-phosphate phosphoketolase
MTPTATEARRKTADVVKVEAAGPLSADELRKMHAYWRAANYLSVGQIYLMDNPLLKEPLQLKHVKPRLLGHWGTPSGQNFLYVHLNRVIKEYDLNMLYISGPGHGGPALVANAYLEGTYSEVHPNIGQDEAGLKQLLPSSLFPAALPAMSPRKPPAPSTKGVSWTSTRRKERVRR